MATSIVRFPVTNEGGSTNASRALSPSLWGKSLEQYSKDSPELGVFYFEDFKDIDRINTTDASANFGWFIQDAAAGGTDENFSNIAAKVDGEIRLGATTGTDHFGIEAHRGSSATTLGSVNLVTHATDPRGRVIYETRIDLSASDNYFVGLTEAIVEFLSSTGTLPANSDYIGFYRADSGDLTFVTANDNNGGTAVSDSVTVLTDAEITALTGYVMLGFAVNSDSTVDIFVNGEYKSVAKDVDPLSLPIETLTQKYATTRGATGDLTTVALDIDWVGTFVAA